MHVESHLYGFELIEARIPPAQMGGASVPCGVLRPPRMGGILPVDIFYLAQVPQNLGLSITYGGSP